MQSVENMTKQISNVSNAFVYESWLEHIIGLIHSNNAERHHMKGKQEICAHMDR